MTKTMLEEALDGWRYAREGVVAELENIPAESFGFQPVPTVRTVAELARHIAIARLRQDTSGKEASRRMNSTTPLISANPTRSTPGQPAPPPASTTASLSASIAS